MPRVNLNIQSFVNNIEEDLHVYMQSVGVYPMLSRSEEQACARIMLSRRDEHGRFISSKELRRRQLDATMPQGAARKRLITANLRWAIRVAAKYVGRGMSLGDLISYGNAGLVTAVDKFDPDRGCRVTTYSAWWIKQTVMRALQKDKTINVPWPVYSDASKLAQFKQDLIQDGIGYSDNLAKKKLKWNESRLHHANSAETTKDVLRVPEFDLYESKASWSNIEDQINSSTDARDAIKRLMVVLPPRYRDVIDVRYGLTDRMPKTLQEVGDHFGVTRERARQIEAAAISMLVRASKIGLKRA